MDASEWRTLYFSLYHPRRSTQTPTWATMSPWPSETYLQIMLKVPNLGMTEAVQNFPLGLPEAISNSEKLSQISPDIGPALAKKVQATLDEMPGAWNRPSV